MRRTSRVGPTARAPRRTGSGGGPSRCLRRLAQLPGAGCFNARSDCASPRWCCLIPTSSCTRSGAVGVIDDLLANNRAFAARFDRGHLDVRPSLRLAIVTCMDSRLDVFVALGLADGQAHILRNAGGVITDDVIRSLAISQRRLGTEEVVLIHHTDCGLQL